MNEAFKFDVLPKSSYRLVIPFSELRDVRR